MKLAEVIQMMILIILIFASTKLIHIHEVLQTETFPRQYVTNNTYDITAKNPGSVLIEDCKEE